MLSFILNHFHHGLTPRLFHELMVQRVLIINDQPWDIHEAELYYYHSRLHPDPSVLPRQCQAGSFYFHQFGFDLAFPSRGDKSSAEYGGILFRSLSPHRANDLITGPVNCRDHILNSAGCTTGMALRISLQPLPNTPEYPLFKCPRQIGPSHDESWRTRPYRYLSSKFLRLLQNDKLTRPYYTHFKNIQIEECPAPSRIPALIIHNCKASARPGISSDTTSFRAGDTVFVLSSMGPYLFVESDDGRVGWVQESCLQSGP